MASLEPLIAYWLHIILIANYFHTSGINNGQGDISVSFVYEINKQKCLSMDEQYYVAAGFLRAQF